MNLYEVTLHGSESVYLLAARSPAYGLFRDFRCGVCSQIFIRRGSGASRKGVTKRLLMLRLLAVNHTIVDGVVGVALAGCSAVAAH